MDLSKLTSEEKAKLIVQLQQKKAELTGMLKQVSEEDPFWTYLPSTGDLTPRAKEFVQKWIKPEDVPVKFDGMLDTFRSKSAIIGTFGGNRAGKTISNAMKAHIKITGEVPPSLAGVFPENKLPTKFPTFGRVYAGSNDVIEEVLIPKFQQWMPKKYWHYQGWERTYSKQDKILRYYRDGKKLVGQIKFVSCEKDVEKTQGVDLNFAHFDEEQPKEFFDECISRFGTGVMDIEFFMTPTNGLSWVYESLFEKGDGQNVDVFKVATVTNAHINYDSLDKQMAQTDTYSEIKMRVLGEFVSLSGHIYKGESAIQKDIHVVQPFELDYSTYLVYRGLDPHLSKPTACVELAVDPAGIKYVVGCYKKEADTEKVKEDLAKRAVERKYRLATTRYDQSLDYEIKALGGMNIVQKLTTPPNPIPAMFPSDKYKGSIDAGIDEIKQDLRPDKFTGKPKIYFFDTPEVWDLIREMKTLERDKAKNEESRGMRDKINEGKRDLHAALRYVYQNRIEWMPMESTHGSDDSYNYEEERFI